MAEGDTAYGNLTDEYSLPDKDVYSLGTLSTGYYVVDVDAETWDYSDTGFGGISKFEILNATGMVVASSISQYTDVAFQALAPNDYYLRITGSYAGHQQYSATYLKTGELNSTPEIISSPVLIVEEDSPHTYTVAVIDVDGDDIFFDASNSILPDWLQLSGNTLQGTPAQADVGRNFVAIAVVDEFGASDIQTFEILVRNTNDAPEGDLLITGLPTLREVLKANTGSITDADGVTAGDIGFQWFRDGKKIPGATDKFYTVAGQDVDARLSVSASYTDNFGTTESIKSAQTEKVAGELVLKGTKKADVLIGARYDDLIFGKGGADELTGAGGSDEILSGAGRDTAKGGAGKDILYGNGGSDALFGQAASDKLLGGGGNDKLVGGSGSDVLMGQKGSDALSGGKGRDVLNGRSGSDVFVFGRADGRDTISDFKAAREVILIESGARRYRDLDIEQVGRDVEISFSKTTIVVEAASASDFTKGVFDFT